MKKYLSDKIIFILTCLLSIVFVFIVFGNLDEKQIYVYLNSDTLYLPSIFKDLFIDGSTFEVWHLNGAPNFFPDMLFFFIIHLFTSNFILALFIFSLFQYCMILIFAYLFLKSCFPKIPLYTLSLGFLLMLFFFFVTTINKDFTHTFYLVSVSYHTSIFTMSLVCGWLISMYLRKEETKQLLLYGIFAYLATLSDKLFLVIFIIPTIFWLVFIIKKENRKKIIIFAVVNVIIVFLAITTYNLIRNSDAIAIISTSGKTLQLENIGSSYKIMLNHHWTYIKCADMRGLIDILALISFLITTILLFRKVRKIFSKTKITNQEYIESCYLIFIVLSTIITFNVPAINGYYTSWAILRYNVYILYLNILNYIYLAYLISNNYQRLVKFIIRPLVVVLLLFSLGHGILYAINTRSIKGLKSFIYYYPEWVKELDEVCEKNKLQYGVSDYWLAKYITMFSKKNLRVYSVHHNLRPWHHVMNEDWYYGGEKGKFANPEFRFVIANSLDTLSLRQKLNNHIVDTLYLTVNDLEILVTQPFIFEKGTKDLIYNTSGEFEN